MNLEFKEIHAEDAKEMLPFYSLRKNKTCDSVFLESFIWRDFYKVRYAIWEGKALLWLMEYKGKCFSAMPLCREEDLPEAFAAIERYFNEELGYPLVINLADEYAVQYLNLPPERYHVEEQEGSGDYLYSGEAMRKLSGRKLHKKKNRLNAFLREYEGRYEYRPLCCSDKDHVWKFLDHWRLQKGENVEEHLDFEVQGIHDILSSCSMLNVRMAGVFIDGRLEAFTIGSYNPVENMAVIHIEKANPEINGLYQFINQQFLVHEFPEAEWVNREDDLGIEGLRKAKMSYNPADFARKYLVEQLIDGKQGYSWTKDFGNTSAKEPVRYLEGEEKQKTRSLWEACFPEDSRTFCDYYYKEKIKDNRILIREEEGEICAMVQRNPYLLQVQEHSWEADYLVGIATAESFRKKGYMRGLLEKVLRDMYWEKKPFTFLMPASEALYTSFEFRYIFCQPQWELIGGKNLSARKLLDNPQDCSEAAAWMEQWLRKRFELYARRDAAYVSRLIKELESEGGCLELLMDGEKPAGLRAFWGSRKREQRLLYMEEGYYRETKERPAIMARITNLAELIRGFSASEEQQWILELSDACIPEQNGSFLLTFTEKGGMLKPKENGEAGGLPVLKADTAKITQWLFGAEKPEKIWPELPQGQKELLQKVRVIRDSFLDEIV